jgi:phosphate transport system substrate-binding protein
MNNTQKTLLGLAVIVIIVAASAAYIYLGTTSAAPKATPTPTASPTATPTATGTPSATAHPSATPTPIATTTTTPTTGPISATLTAQGASFPYPLLSAMITSYTNAHSTIQVNYQSTGSGAGVSAIQAKTADFIGSDAPLSATDMTNIPNAVHIPETIGAVTLCYNLPGVPTGLNLTGQIIADIYQGVITQWNDPAIQNINPGVTLPSNVIVTVHRSDSSGTTFIFTGYLKASSTSWASAIGQGKSVAWPVGVGSNNNAGVASTVNGTRYALGYVELAYALQNGMTVAAVKNPAGNYVLPSLATTTAAAQSVASSGLPKGNESWTNVNVLNAPESQAYPIVSFTYLITYKELNVIPGMTQDKATALVQFLWYVVHDGQNLSPNLAYAQLPSNVVAIDEATLRSITYNGQTLI